mmetsp:Transcript_27002/g.26066  ORF Transcript_27002/g.26066 Transcript_27002/m.26066 type:complete len:97 (+) Transcript_27002:339-629(+)
MIANPFNLEDSTQKFSSIEYGTGTILGKYAQDTLCFGSDQRVCLENFSFIEAIVMSNDPFEDLLFDGILGLARSKLSLTKQFNFLERLSVYNLNYF